MIQGYNDKQNITNKSCLVNCLINHINIRKIVINNQCNNKLYNDKNTQKSYIII